LLAATWAFPNIDIRFPLTAVNNPRKMAFTTFVAKFRHFFGVKAATASDPFSGHFPILDSRPARIYAPR
jgi:hypothetical protein